MKTELKQLRTLAELRLRSGAVPDWSWPQHVRLIEALDAVLHDVSVTESQPAKRYAGGPLRLVSDNPPMADTRRKTGSMH